MECPWPSEVVVELRGRPVIPLWDWLDGLNADFRGGFLVLAVRTGVVRYSGPGGGVRRVVRCR